MPSNNNFDKTITYTVIDKQTGLPVDSAYVMFTYGNAFLDDKFTGTDGKASFTIPTSWVVNDVKITKNKYCDYYMFYNSTYVDPNPVIHLNHYSYLRIHVENFFPSATSDKIEVVFTAPTGFNPFIYTFYGIVDTTFISLSYTGNIGMVTNVYSGSNYLYSTHPYVTTLANDTVDVHVKY